MNVPEATDVAESQVNAVIDDNPVNLLRDDLRDFAGYSSARSEKRAEL